MQSLADIKAILESQGLRPSKSLGQNFLIEPAHVQRLLAAAAEAGVGDGALVLEVGPGTGVLTDELLGRGCTVVACELDGGLAAMLRERYAAPAAAGRFRLIEGDCLDGKHDVNSEVLAALGPRSFFLVANLPYGAASPLMIALATRHCPTLSGASGSDGVCLGQFVTIQREVAERLRAKSGTRDYGEMGVLVQAMCEVKRIAILPPGCFWPPPKIDSEMVSIIPRAQPLTDDPAALSRLCRMLFTQRRKQIGSILAREAPQLVRSLPEDVTPTMRPEELSITSLIALAWALKNQGPADAGPRHLPN